MKAPQRGEVWLVDLGMAAKVRPALVISVPAEDVRKRQASVNTKILEGLAIQALRLGFDTLEVEYKDGFEDVAGLKGGLGIGIARFRSSSPEGAALRRELYKNLKKPQRLTLDEVTFSLRSRLWDSFGEDAFRVTLRRESKSGSAGRRRKISSHGST